MEMFEIPRDPKRKDKHTGDVIKWEAASSTPRFREFVASYVFIELRAEQYWANLLERRASAIAKKKCKSFVASGRQPLDGWLRDRATLVNDQIRTLIPRMGGSGRASLEAARSVEKRTKKAARAKRYRSGSPCRDQRSVTLGQRLGVPRASGEPERTRAAQNTTEPEVRRGRAFERTQSPRDSWLFQLALAQTNPAGEIFA